jgi:flagellar basal-body rod protein FlgB
MDPTRIALFDLAQARMRWAEQRQSLLAKNIANANTPGYQPVDVPPFARLLSNGPAMAPSRTQPGHLAGSDPGGLRPAARHPRIHNPDGNAVALDQQLTQVADTETTQTLTTTIYRKYMALFAIALGRTS